MEEVEEVEEVEEIVNALRLAAVMPGDWALVVEPTPTKNVTKTSKGNQTVKANRKKGFVENNRWPMILGS